MLGVVLIAPCFLGVLGAVARRPAAGRSACCSVLLRVAFVALLALGLARLARTATTQKVCTVYLVDVCDSVPDEALGDARARGREGLGRAAEGRARAARHVRAAPARSSRPTRRTPRRAAARSSATPTPKGQRGELGAGTNLQAALQLAYGLYPPGYLQRAVLLSDGVQTDGDLLAEANRARELRRHALHRPLPPPRAAARSRCASCACPTRCKVGETFDDPRRRLREPRARRRSASSSRARRSTASTACATSTSRPGDNDVVFKSVVPRRRRGDVRARARPRSREDRSRRTTATPSPSTSPAGPSVLYVEGNAAARAATLAARSPRSSSTSTCARRAASPARSRSSSATTSSSCRDMPARGACRSTQQDADRAATCAISAAASSSPAARAGYGLGGWYHTTIERILPVRMDAEKQAGRARASRWRSSSTAPAR